MSTDLNPFLNNIFSPQGHGGGSPRRAGSPIGQVQFPVNGSTMPMPQPPQQPSLVQQGLNAALDGAGTYLQNLARAKEQTRRDNTLLQRDLSGLVQRQGENKLDSAQAVMNVSPAGSDIEPFANMALRRALIGGFQTPQIQAPAGIPMGKMSGGLNLEALKPVMDQYFSDNAIRASMQHQQSLRNNLDPDTPQSTAGLQIFGSQEGDSYQPYYDAAVGVADAARNRQNFSDTNAQRALQEAIMANNKASKGSVWKALGSALVKAAPYVAAPFTGGASLMATPITNKINF